MIEGNQFKEDVTMLDINYQDDVIEKKVELKEGLLYLLEEEECYLEVKCEGSRFYPASNYFSSRILEILSKDVDAEWKDSKINNHQFELKFKGYKTIFVNTELETYWFEGSNEIFSATGIEELWNRYTIKIIEDSPVYYSFEKSILAKIDGFMRQDNKDHVVLLFYDGDIRLKVDDNEIVVQENIDYQEYSGRRIQDYSNIPNKSANVEYIRSLDLLMYTFQGVDASGLYTSVKFYRYVNKQIEEVFSSSNIGMGIEIDPTKLSDKLVEVKLPYIGESIELQLSEEQVKSCKVAILDMDYNRKIEMIQANIFFVSREIMFEDFDKDDNLELYISGDFRTYGSSNLISLKGKATFIFKLYSNRLECIEVIFEQ